jgi:hypothetical protein
MKCQSTTLFGLFVIAFIAMPHSEAQQLNPTPADHPSNSPLFPSFEEVCSAVYPIPLDGMVDEEGQPLQIPPNEYGFIDSSTGLLRYSCTDINSPFADGELTLGVKRKYRPESWTHDARSVHGQNPMDHIGVNRPFGMCWSSGIGAGLYVASYYVVEQGVWPSPLPSSSIHAGDETGASFVFSRNPVLPLPSNVPVGMDIEEALDKGIVPSVFAPTLTNDSERTGLSPSLQRAEGQDGEYVLTRTSGTLLRYEGIPSRTIIIPMDKDGKRFKVMRHHRLMSVTESSGRVIAYDYPPRGTNGSGTLIPCKITATEPAQGTDPAPAPREIIIQTGANDMVSNVTSPSGQVWNYQYQYRKVAGFDLPLLHRVVGSGVTVAEYDYDTSLTNIPEDAPRSTGDTAALKHYFHVLLKEIALAPPGGTTRFKYRLDDTVRIPALVKVNHLYSAEEYTPRAARTPLLTSAQNSIRGTALFDLRGPVTLNADVDAATGTLTRTGLDGSRTMTVTSVSQTVRVFQHDEPTIINGLIAETETSPPPLLRAPIVRVAWGTSLVSTPNSADPVLDVDGNGIPDAWELQHFGSIGVDPNADYDGDGLTNLEEYQNEVDQNSGPNFGNSASSGEQNAGQSSGTVERANYKYDSMGRLTEADGIIYNFDKEGNLESSN